MVRKGLFISCLAGAGLLITIPAVAQQQPLPKRLTLEHALSLVEQSQHPELERAKAELERAEAGRLEAESLTGANAEIVGRLRYVEPNDRAPEQGHDDHALGIYVSKPLYDFGRSAAAETAAEEEIRSQQSSYINAYNAQRLRVMQRFFDVIISDHQFLLDNEEMAYRFVRVDKAKERYELGQISEAEVLRLETIYQDYRLNRYRSEAQQRSTRAKLALAMNLSGQTPDEVVYPQLPSIKRDIPNEFELQKLALQNNPVLVASRAAVKSAKAKVDAARAGDNPVLSAEAEATNYTRELGGNDDARIGLQLRIPLYTGGRDDAAIAKARAELRRARADLVAMEGEVLQAILDAVLDIRTLRAQLQQAEVQRNWSDINLDLRRSQYEMEQVATLGVAMVEIARAELMTARTELQLAMTWARLDALLGKTVYDQNQAATDKPVANKVEP